MKSPHRLRQRNNEGHELLAVFIVLGLILGGIAWATLLRPNTSGALLATLPQQPLRAPDSPPVATQPAADIAVQPLQPQTEKLPPAQEGDFCRYTDDQGVIHLANNPDHVPEKYRNQLKIYRDRHPSTPVRMVNNQVFVPVVLRNGTKTVQATLLLDTGCTVTSISEHLAARLEIDRRQARPSTARVADGRIVPTLLAKIDQAAVGVKTKTPLDVSILPSSGSGEMADGLLGMNFLKDFRYQLDVAGQRIVWR